MNMKFLLVALILCAVFSILWAMTTGTPAGVLFATLSGICFGGIVGEVVFSYLLK